MKKMADVSTRKNLMQVLSATGYCLNLNRNDRLDSIQVYSDSKPFFNWFYINISQDNCVSQDELEEYTKLVESHEVIFGEDLEESLHDFQSWTVWSWIHYGESFSETICDELTFIEEQLTLRDNLHSVIRLFSSSLTTELKRIHKSESLHNNAMMKLLSSNKDLISLLCKVKKMLDELQEDLSEVDLDSESSVDEGIDTLSSDNLVNSKWSNTSTLSVQSTSSTKDSNYLFLIQLPFHKYNKLQERFFKIMNIIVQKLWPKIGLAEELELEIPLELQNIMERLGIQKKLYLFLLTQIEGINTVQAKITDYVNEVTTCKLILERFRSEIIDIEDQTIDLEDSFTNSTDELIDIYETWAKYQMLTPICDSLKENNEYSTYKSQKMDELTSIVSAILAANIILCEMLDWERMRVKTCVELFTSMKDMIRNKMKSTRHLVNTMIANHQDYKSYCTLPVVERSELKDYLAAIAGPNQKNIVQSLRDIYEYLRRKHAELHQNYSNQLHNNMIIECEMKELYYKDLQNPRQPNVGSNSNLFLAIQRTLVEMSNEIMDTMTYCHSVQEDHEISEDIELEPTLKRYMRKNKNK